MDDVEPGRISGYGAFGPYGGVHRPDVRFRTGIRSVFDVPGKSNETYGSEHGENRDHDDEFREGERGNHPAEFIALRKKTNDAGWLEFGELFQKFHKSIVTSTILRFTEATTRRNGISLKMNVGICH